MLTFVNDNTEVTEDFTDGCNDYVLGDKFCSRQFTVADYYDNEKSFLSMTPSFEVYAYEGEDSHLGKYRPGNGIDVSEFEDFAKTNPVSITVECNVEILEHSALDDLGGTEIRSEYKTFRSGKKYSTVEEAMADALIMCEQTTGEDLFAEYGDF